MKYNNGKLNNYKYLLAKDYCIHERSFVLLKPMWINNMHETLNPKYLNIYVIEIFKICNT